MKSKERVLTAFARQQPDRVPVNYLANPGIDARLKQHFGLGKDDGEGLLRALGVDFRHVGASYTGSKLHPDLPEQGVRVDNWGVHKRWIEHETGGYWDYCDFPLREADEETVARWPMPNQDHYDYSGVAAACARQRDFAVIAGGAGNGDVINHGGMLRSMEQVLIDLALDEPAFALLTKRRTDIQLAMLERILTAARGGIDLLWMGEDLGTQQGPMISLDMYRRHLRPVHQKFVDLGKAFGIPVMIHSCGSSSWAFNDFIEMGISIVDTLQPEAANMAPAYLKQTYGHRLAFHGCISTAGPLATGTPEEVRKICRKTLDVMMPGGGYILAPTHAIQDNTPTENVVAMYATAREHGAYRR